MKIILPLLLIFLTSCVAKTQTGSDQNYPDLKAKIVAFQEKQASLYAKADSIQKDSIVQATKTKLFDFLVKDIFPCWYGTKWDYNGTTETPQEGEIACGYFVTTTLRDLGLNLNRYKYAQMASESMILKLTPKVKRFSNVEDEVTLNYFKKFPTGIFIVGLDSHTGFVVKTKKSINFIHAVKYDDIDGVVSQELESDNLFNISSYKVVGEILHEEMIKNWLEKKSYE